MVPLVVEFVKARFGFVASTDMQLEPLPKPSAELPVPTVPLFATVVLVFVALTKRTVAVFDGVTISSSSPQAASRASEANATRLRERCSIGGTSKYGSSLSCPANGYHRMRGDAAPRGRC